MFFSLLLFEIHKARNIICNIIMIFNINSTRGQMRFLTCVARVTCLVLYKTVKEKDLDVTLLSTRNANMKVSEQCRIAASHGNQILECSEKYITCKEKGFIDCTSV